MKYLIDRVYENKGNVPLISMLGCCTQLLDVGCGAGSNAILVKEKFSSSQIYGITYSNSETNLASKHMNHCWTFNVEDELPSALKKKKFDALIFSHILEHLRDPANVLSKFSELLVKDGQILIAVPNVLSWRMRLQFLFGYFEYESAGVLDDTHLRFFTYDTADKYLLSKSNGLTLVDKKADGSVPLWFLRRHILPQPWCKKIDDWGCRHWPNLFGGQILLKVIKH